MTVTVSASNFDEVVMKSDKPFCWILAVWCGPCRMVAPTVEKLIRITKAEPNREGQRG
jgi:thioredoxin 1